MKISHVKGVKAATSQSKITAADEDDGFGDFEGFGGGSAPDPIGDSGDGMEDAIDDLQDSVDDLQDSMEDIVEDDPNIDITNNIENHYIAECEKCKGIFISATVESDQDVDSISGICPLCEQETEQLLKWVIRAKGSDDSDSEETKLM